MQLNYTENNIVFILLHAYYIYPSLKLQSLFPCKPTGNHMLDRESPPADPELDRVAFICVETISWVV